MKGQKGGVLLLVLWVTAALSFVALSLALGVRTEIEATRHRVEAEQGRFLARAGIEQTLFLTRNQGLTNAQGRPLLEPGQGEIVLPFETGEARVTIMPEAAKIGVNTATEQTLRRLLAVAGAEGAQAREVAAALVDWRSPASEIGGRFDSWYRSLQPPYRPAHAPFQRLEEVLLVKGMTPELFYGWVERTEDGGVVRRGGLNRLLTTYAASGAVSLNDSPYEVLLTVPSMSPEAAQRIVAARRLRRFRTMDDVPLSLPLGAMPYVTLTMSSEAFSLTATGRANGAATTATVRGVFRRDPAQPGQVQLVDWQEQAIEN